jgi:hypothetical protein
MEEVFLVRCDSIASLIDNRHYHLKIWKSPVRAQEKLRTNSEVTFTSNDDQAGLNGCPDRTQTGETERIEKHPVENPKAEVCSRIPPIPSVHPEHPRKRNEPQMNADGH